MTILLISTTRRHTPTNEISGKLITYDLEKQRVIQETEIIEPPFRDLNPNPRGGIRGLKGISYSNGSIAIANSSSIFVYDKNWNLIHTIEHPSLAGIHDIFFSGNELWVSSARNDIIARIDLNNEIKEIVDIRTLDAYKKASTKYPAPLQSREDHIRGGINFRDPTTHDEVSADSAHVNSVFLDREGNLYFSCGLIRNTDHLRAVRWKTFFARLGILDPLLKINDLVFYKFVKKNKKNKNETIAKPFAGKSLFLKLATDGSISQIIELNGVTVPSHSIRELPDGQFVYLRTNDGNILTIDPGLGLIKRSIKVGENFLRGFCNLSDGTGVAGDGNEIALVDLEEGKVLSRYRISDDKNENVFDILPLPDGFAQPPNSFVTFGS